MGGGGSFNYSSIDRDEIFNKIKASENAVDKQRYESEVNSIISKNLISHKNKDPELTKEYLAEIKEALKEDYGGTISTQFGGSLAKKTYIEGLSDIDTLVILNKSELASATPEAVLNYFSEKLKEKYSSEKIHQGDHAVTVTLGDVEIQLLPALKFKSGLKIPDEGGKSWSSIIQPNVFTRKLTVINERLNKKLIPTIRLAKVIIAKLPENAQLTGYHAEALGISIFSSMLKAGHIEKEKIATKDLLKIYFREASKAVREPIRDLTHQTTYVDEYLGPKNNVKRLIVADALDRVARRLDFAETSLNSDNWEELIS